MCPEYLYNNDTQDICRHVQELATKNEPALRAHCQEVSRQTDTSSRALREECISKTNAAGDAFEAILNVLSDLSGYLSVRAGFFGMQNGQSAFANVCSATLKIEEGRLRLLSCIADLTQVRYALAKGVAEMNQALHFLSVAKRAVPEAWRSQYAADIKCIENAYEKVKRADADICEVQKFYMTVIENHLPTFMEKLRVAADFNHAGEALNSTTVCTLCRELLVLQNCVPNVSF